MAQTSSNSTYKISFKKIARAALAEVRVHKKLAIISFVLFGVSFLLAVFHADVFQYYYGDAAVFQPSLWAIVFAGGGVVVSYFTALNVFRDTNNQQLCDVSMALPIKASERFLSKLLCLFYLQVAPLIVAVLGGNGIKILYGVIKFGKMEPETAETLFMYVFGFLAATMFIMAVAVLAACCCGAFAESAYFSLIMMAIINALPVFFINQVVCGASGINTTNPFSDFVDLGWWGLIYLLGYTDDIVLHCAVGCVISLVVMLLSGIIYVRRDAKTVGAPVASRVFFEIVMFTGCMTIFSMSVMNTAVMWGVLIAGVIYVIINIIVSRARISPLSFVKWAAKYIATAAAFTALLVATINTGGFGLINARPDKEYLDGATFEVYVWSYGEKFDHIPDKYGNYRFISDGLTADRADEAMSIIKEHIVKGREKISTADIIFDNIYGEGRATVRVDAESINDIIKKPSPAFCFRRFNDNVYGKIWKVDFGQYITITLDEAEAMLTELIEGGYVQTYVTVTDHDYPESEQGSVVYY
ncbi:MAG: hypothetical protein NC299_03290 [Lachnospiraceae bacterium]|nr:hypothetical protein [Ruminococcus sp.]MCM1274373.1 hypothetical protein [Lachnospiraceae bacterium]